MKKRFSDEQIISILREAEAGFLPINYAVNRIYHLNNLGVKRRRLRKGLATDRLSLFCPDTPNLTWSVDFVMDALASDRRIKYLA